MSWEYRVIREVAGKTTHWYTYYIGEVYTDPFGMTQEPIAPGGDSLDELRRDLQHMLSALDKPMLDAKTGEELSETGD